jgi:hypothetical protein
MTKQFTAILALTMFTTSAFAQISLPSSKRGDLPTVPDLIRSERTINILQVQQVVPAALLGGGKGTVPMPSGVTDAAFCLAGPLVGKDGIAGSAVTPLLDFPACRFVGGVLCLDPGPNGDFESFLVDCPIGTTPAIQGVKLRKVEPRIPKCPDTYPGLDFTQTGVSGIRTFWPLKYTPCDTTFTLDLELGCVGRDAQGRIRVLQVRVNRYIFKVVARADTFRWVIEALHCQPLALTEVPCITDEALFARLLSQADLIAAAARDAATGNQSRLRDLNDLLDRTEDLIVRYCLFTFATWGEDGKGGLDPVTIFDEKGGPGFIPGNKTIEKFGFGIVDTIEHPCCCKLIADIYCIKGALIGRDP